jgi:hypothetical protein
MPTCAEITGTPVHRTKYAELRYQLVEGHNVGLYDVHGHMLPPRFARFWRWVDAEGAHIGRDYPTREALLSDLESEASLRGCAGAAPFRSEPCTHCGR